MRITVPSARAVPGARGGGTGQTTMTGPWVPWLRVGFVEQRMMKVSLKGV